MINDADKPSVSPRVFAAYRTKDLEVVKSIVAEIEFIAGSPLFWLSHRDLAPTTKDFTREILRQIQTCNKSVIFLSSGDTPRNPAFAGIHLDRELELLMVRINLDATFKFYIVRLDDSAKIPEMLLRVAPMIIFDLIPRNNDFLSKLYELARLLMFDDGELDTQRTSIS